MTNRIETAFFSLDSHVGDLSHVHNMVINEADC